MAHWITKIIEIERQAMVDEGEAADFQDINRGQCEDFAERVVAIAMAQSAEGDAPDIESTELRDFFVVDPETGYTVDNGGPIDRDAVMRALPSMSPPAGMSWDELDALLAHEDYGAGMHAFIVCDGMVYDSEASEGVDGIFDLPFFGRALASAAGRQPLASPKP